MKQTRNQVLTLIVFLGIGSFHAFAEPFAEGPYLGQTPPGSTAQVFAPGLISDTRPQTWESHGTFSADGNAFCFRRVEGVFFTENIDQGWTAPKLIESIKENQPDAWSPCLSPDANSIYFTKALFKPASKRNIYRCDRTTLGWDVPQVLGPPLSSSTPEVTCSIAANNSMYFGSNRKEAPFEKSIIWAAPFVNNTWSRATYISFSQIQDGRPADPGIAPDESFMVFTVRREPGPSWDRDIYLTLRLPDGTWSKPRKLGPRINTTYIEHSPRISPDKKYLFFTRSDGWDPRKHSADIYWVELKEYLAEPNDPNINQTDSGISTNDLYEDFFARGPYLGQTPPGPVAQVFAPGLISDTQPHSFETTGNFSADGNTFCFRQLRYVYITENTDQGWTKPKLIKSIPYMTWSCCLSPDANTIYFMDQLLTRSAKNRGEPSKHIYQYCTRSPQGWSLPKELGPPFSSAMGGFSLLADNSLCFKSRQGSFWVAPSVDNTWGQAIKLPIEKRNLHGCDPGIAPDKSFLVFYSIRPGAQGGTPTDLYLTLRRADGTWTKPQRMGPGINTEYYEIGPKISPDKKYMFFTRSNGWNLNLDTDTGDIYWVELKEHLPESYR